MTATFPISPRSATHAAAFDLQELYQSQSTEIRAVYDRALVAGQESVTTVHGNDVGERFRVAYLQLPMTAEQRDTVQQLEAALRYVEKQIDPKRLYFTIRSSPDEDVVLNHNQPAQLSTIIVHDDGSMAFARIYAEPAPEQDDELISFKVGQADCELLAYRFLSGQ